MRTPKAIMVSSYYFHQMAGFLQDPRTFDEFMAAFLEWRSEITSHVESFSEKCRKFTCRRMFVCSLCSNNVDIHVVCSAVWKIDIACEQLEARRAGRQNNVHHLWRNGSGKRNRITQQLTPGEHVINLMSWKFLVVWIAIPESKGVAYTRHNMLCHLCID